MERTAVQRLARVLRVLVVITFMCNLIVLFLVPGMAAFYVGGGDTGLLENNSAFQFIRFFTTIWHPVIWMLGATGEGQVWVVLSLFLLFCGGCTALILWQAKKVLDTILKGEPFTLGNAVNLKRAAVCCFLISGAALVRLVWGFAYYRSIGPLFTYNALFVPVFFMAGLLCLVMSALFHQAAELKEDQDLTI